MPKLSHLRSKGAFSVWDYVRVYMFLKEKNVEFTSSPDLLWGRPMGWLIHSIRKQKSTSSEVKFRTGPVLVSLQAVPKGTTWEIFASCYSTHPLHSLESFREIFFPVHASSPLHPYSSTRFYTNFSQFKKKNNSTSQNNSLGKEGLFFPLLPIKTWNFLIWLAVCTLAALGVGEWGGGEDGLCGSLSVHTAHHPPTSPMSRSQSSLHQGNLENQYMKAFIST